MQKEAKGFHSKLTNATSRHAEQLSNIQGTAKVSPLHRVSDLAFFVILQANVYFLYNRGHHCKFRLRAPINMADNRIT